MEYPAHLAVADATYLDDDNVVFGIAVNGEARAYPKRILAWHEMALDRVGGLELTIVYCHAVRHRHPVREHRRRTAHPVRHQWSAVSVEQDHVRSGNQESVEYVRGGAGHR